jgi:hypothetical protein
MTLEVPFHERRAKLRRARMPVFPARRMRELALLGQNAEPGKKAFQFRAAQRRPRGGLSSGLRSGF